MIVYFSVLYFSISQFFVLIILSYGVFCLIDGRHFKTVYGKDLVDGLISHSDSMMEEFEKSVGDQLATGQNKVTSLQGQLDLLRSHQATQDRRINYSIARSAEEADGRVNERFSLFFGFC